MALTAEERLLAFEILDLPPTGSGFEMTGTLGVADAVELTSFGSPAAAVDAALSALTAEAESLVVGLIGEWKLVRTSEVELSEAEGVSGTVRGSDAKRELIRRRLLVYVPVYREGELEARHGKFRSGAGSNMIRRG